VASLTSQSCGAAVNNLIGSDVLSLGIYTRTVLVEVVDCVGQHACGRSVAGQQAAADIERNGGLASNFQSVALALCGEVGEVDHLVVVPAAVIVDNLAISCAGVNNVAARILDGVVILLGVALAVQDQSSLLGSVRIVTNLVYFNAGDLIIRSGNIVGLVVGHINQCQVVEPNDCASREALFLSVTASTAHVECPLTGTICAVGLIYNEFISISRPLVCRNGNALPSVPALTVVNSLAGLASALQLVNQLVRADAFLIGHAQLFAVAVPHFLVIVGHVAQLCIHMTGVGRVYTISYTISVTPLDGQISMTELAVPTVLTAVTSTAGSFDQDRINAICDVELHFTSCVFANVPRQALAVFESTFSKLIASRGSQCDCAQTGRSRRGCHNSSREHGDDLLAESFLQHKYPP